MERRGLPSCRETTVVLGKPLCCTEVMVRCDRVKWRAVSILWAMLWKMNH